MKNLGFQKRGQYMSSEGAKLIKKIMFFSGLFFCCFSIFAQAPQATFNIGDRGPGGGLVFYARNGRYMEASGRLGAAYSIREATRITRNHRGGGFSDWRLPAYDELRMIHQNLRRRNLGDFGNDTYFSSSSWQAHGLTFYQMIMFIDGRRVNSGVGGGGIASFLAVREFSGNQPQQQRIPSASEPVSDEVFWMSVLMLNEHIRTGEAPRTQESVNAAMVLVTEGMRRIGQRPEKREFANFLLIPVEFILSWQGLPTGARQDWNAILIGLYVLAQM